MANNLFSKPEIIALKEAMVVDVEQIQQNSKDISSLKGDLSQIYVGGITHESPNIFDKTNIESGKRMNIGGTIVDDVNGFIYELPVVLSASSSFTVSVNSVFNWRGNSIHIIQKNDGSYRTYAQFEKIGDVYTATFTTGTSECIAKISCLTDTSGFNINTFMIVNGDHSAMPSEYVPFGTIVDGRFTDFTDNHIKEVVKTVIPSTTDTWYKGKKLATLGDSITAMGYWQPFVKEYFGFGQFVNCGYGGTTIHNNGQIIDGNEMWMCSDYRVNQLPVDSDVVLIMGGINDWSVQMEMGSIAYGSDKTADDTTFLGAYQIMLTKVIKRCPNAMIVCMTPMNTKVWTYETNLDNPVINWNKSITDFADACILAARNYGCKYIDLNSESGICAVNQSKYCQDAIHPNSTTGAKAIANAVINGLKRFEPITFEYADYS